MPKGKKKDSFVQRTLNLEEQAEEEEEGSRESKMEREPSTEPAANLSPQQFQAEHVVPLSSVATGFSMSVQFVTDSGDVQGFERSKPNLVVGNMSFGLTEQLSWAVSINRWAHSQNVKLIVLLQLVYKTTTTSTVIVKKNSCEKVTLN